MPLSKPFVIATEGPTIDGRNISRQWIADMAKNYDPKVYTAVANLEHFLSSLPDGIFKAYGKVVSLSTQEAELMGEKKLQLLAVVDASEELVALQKKGQKAFSSMEVLNNFIGKGVAYLSGLAFTDSPASIGTESMQFSLGGTAGERFASQSETAIEFEEQAPAASLGDTLFAKVKGLLGFEKKAADDRFADHGKAIEAIATSQRDTLAAFSKIEKEMAEMGAAVKLNADALKARADEFAALEAKLATTDGDKSKRPAATGGDGKLLAEF
ncbi:MAG: GPO family capsid scaffolding protein [Rhodocyclales bacterium]|nr:GPO family capsid scaffolding protein [Rhodocyclales bacterium]